MIVCNKILILPKEIMDIYAQSHPIQLIWRKISFYILKIQYEPLKGIINNLVKLNKKILEDINNTKKRNTTKIR